LENVYPELNFEIINLGLTAVNSFTVKDLLEEAIKYQPDLFIIYTGHNEFYGAFGVGSLESSGGKFLINISLKLEKYRTFLLLKDLINFITNLFSSQDIKNESATLMEVMAKERSILYHGSLYEECKSNFKQNIEDCLKTATKNNIPVILSNLVSNLRDQYPFTSAFSPTLNENDRNLLKKSFNEGGRLQNENKIKESISFYRQALQIDSMPAEVHYQLAKALEDNNDSLRAREQYMIAKDFDGLRFRSTQEFNDIIYYLSKDWNSYFVNMEDSLSKYSLHNIIGNELILEHLHPNLKGYFLMAKVFANYIINNRIISLKYNLNPSFMENDSYFEINSGFNVLDSIASNIRIKTLMSRWPFTERGSHSKILITCKLEEIANNYCKSIINWEKAQVETAEYFLNLKDYFNAGRCFLALTKITPYNSSPFKYLAECYINQGELKKAEKIYLKLLKFEKSAEVYEKLGTIYLELEKSDIAIDNIKRAIELDKNGKISDIIWRRYCLSLAYLQLKDYSKVEQEINYILSIDPGYQKAVELKNYIKTIK
jgi:tetratricopeptide (TPR) repeat protein